MDAGNSWRVFCEHRVSTTGWLPECVRTEGDRCWDCPLEDPAACPIRGDPDYFDYLRWLRSRYVARERLRVRRIGALRSILVRHKLPLHWQMVAKIAEGEFPKLFDSPESVKQWLVLNPAVFEPEQEGIFGLTEWQARA